MLDQYVSELFDSYFDIKLAHTQDLINESSKIRYKVYCEELGFEDASAFPDGMEVDSCDKYSHHYLIQHRRTGVYAGTVRLVDPSLSHAPAKCPIETYCIDTITHPKYSPAILPQGTYAEVSRLAVTAEFRRRTGEKGKPFVYEGERVSMHPEESKAFPYIAIGLYLSAAAHFINESRLKYLFVMMEPRLKIHLRRVGINFTEIGEPMEYHGLRAPYYSDEPGLLANMHPAMKMLYDKIESTVVSQLRAHTSLQLKAG